MADEEREMIPLESNLYKTDPVINQHIMQMIDTDISWYEKTFRASQWNSGRSEMEKRLCKPVKNTVKKRYD